ncbi:MAG TPA: MBL fold metallo-hydrolase [Candidatus Binatia bacterium]|nr:MBL fold metallo-hydrolase [Candidatus Binatia bacterium]
MSNEINLKRLFLWLLARAIVLSFGAAMISPVTSPAVAAESPRSTSRHIQWLGTSSWILSSSDDVVVVDPFFTRSSFVRVSASLMLPFLPSNFAYDPERIRAVLPELPGKTRFVLLSHAHYDHLLDVPYYINQNSGRSITYVGSLTARNILLGFKPSALDFVVAEQKPSIIKGRVRVTALTSDHAPHFFGHTFMAGDVVSPMTSIPSRVGQYLEGQTLVFLVDFLDAQESVVWRIFINGAVNSPAGAEALRQHQSLLNEHRINVAILCVPGWDKVDDYPDTLLRLLRPENIVLSHYDDFGSPYIPGEDPNNGMRALPFANYHRFVERLRLLNTSNNYGFSIHEPKTGQCISFSGSNATTSCQQ